MNDNAPLPARLVPIIGEVGAGDRVRIYDTPAGRGFLEQARAIAEAARPTTRLRLVE